jgi:hypothetical protein
LFGFMLNVDKFQQSNRKNEKMYIIWMLSLYE